MRNSFRTFDRSWQPGMGLNPVNPQAREDLLDRDFSGEYHGPTIDQLAAWEDADNAAAAEFFSEIEP